MSRHNFGTVMSTQRIGHGGTREEEEKDGGDDDDDQEEAKEEEDAETHVILMTQAAEGTP